MTDIVKQRLDEGRQKSNDNKLNASKRADISNKEFCQIVARSSRYDIYEIEDIVLHIVGNLQKLLSEGKSVQFTGLGKFHIVERKSRFIEGKGIVSTKETGPDVTVTRTLQLKTTKEMKQTLNPER